MFPLKQRQADLPWQSGSPLSRQLFRKQDEPPSRALLHRFQALGPFAIDLATSRGDGRLWLNLALTKPCKTGVMKALIPLLFLAACASPAPEFMGATRTDVTVKGRDYTVFQKGERVEVIRLGYARRGEHQEIRATMIELIPRVTGCKLRETTLQGDSGEMRGSVSCP
jgi:hypothetical protein